MNIERPRPAGIPVAFRFALAEGAAPSHPEGASPGLDGGPRPSAAGPIPSLSAKAIALLTRHGGRNRAPQRGARSGEGRADRAAPARLLRAAGRVSREELLARPRGGPRLVAEIDAWLAAHGRRFRPNPAPIPDALAQALGHIEAMLDGHDEDAFLSAFVALPELRRSLAARKAPRRSPR